MRFPSRKLLRVISLTLGLLVLGLLAGIVALTIARDSDVHTEMMWFVVPILLLPFLWIGKMISDSWSVLEVDAEGIRVRKLLGRPHVRWDRIGSLRYWEVVQLVHGVPAREYFVDVSDQKGKRLLRLKSTFEPEAYAYLLEQARTRSIRIDAP
jgi:hypothetical protein